MHEKLSKSLLHSCCFLKVASLIVSVSWNGLVEGGYPAAMIWRLPRPNRLVGSTPGLQLLFALAGSQGCTFSLNSVSYAHAGAACVSLPRK